MFETRGQVPGLRGSSTFLKLNSRWRSLVWLSVTGTRSIYDRRGVLVASNGKCASSSVQHLPAPMFDLGKLRFSRVDVLMIPKRSHSQRSSTCCMWALNWFVEVNRDTDFDLGSTARKCCARHVALVSFGVQCPDRPKNRTHDLLPLG